MKIILEKEKCIGCGSCVALCPKFFELKEDGKVHLKNSLVEIEETGCVKEAIEVCPVQCIKIEK